MGWKLKFALMFSRIINHLPGNNRKKGRVKIEENKSLFLGCKFLSNGDDNVISFGTGGIYRKCVFSINGNGNKISIGKYDRANGATFCIEDDLNKILIGDNVCFAGQIHIACTEGTSIVVGNDSLFSSDIVIRSGDSHTIYDVETERRINQAQNIVIEEHVWCTQRVSILKGTNIAKNSVVGTGAIVTGNFTEPNVIIAGVPGKIVKRNINWRYQR